MDYDAVLAHVLALLQQEQRVAYRILKRRFALDENDLEDLKDDLIYAKKLAVDEDNRVLVWVGEQAAAAAPPPVPATSVLTSAPASDHAHEPLSYTPQHLAEKILTKKRREAPAFMPGMDRRWARRAQCPRAQQDPRSA